MRLRLSSFCAISRNDDWHKFLSENAPDLLKELTEFLRTSTGCRDAKTKMIEIYKKLYAANAGEKLEGFIRSRFPYIIEQDDQPKRRAVRREPRKIIVPSNKHGVFKSYKPGILTFPHRHILADSDTKRLLEQVKIFIRDKVSPDYIIIGDTAYIEYLLPKYKDVADQIPEHAKEIEQYRLRNKK